MVHNLIIGTAGVLGAAIVMIGIWSVGQQRQLRSSQRRLVHGDQVNGVTRQDLVNGARALARLQSAHDATRDRIGGLQQERDDLKDELAWLLAELAVRPEPHPIVRFLHDRGPHHASSLVRHLGPVSEEELAALVASGQITTLDRRSTEGASQYRFVPHHQRATPGPLVSLNRYLALLVDTPSTTDLPFDPLAASTPTSAPTTMPTASAALARAASG